MQKQDLLPNLTKGKREKFRVEFRKQTTELLLNQKRNIFFQDPSTDILQETSPIMNEIDRIMSFGGKLFEAMEVQNREEIFIQMRNLRNATCLKDGKPPYDAILNTQIIPHIIKMLGNKLKEYDEINMEGLWLLTNISASDDGKILKYLIDNNLLFYLREILTHCQDIKLIDQAVMCSANLASEEELRDIFFLEEFDYTIQKILTERKEDHSKTLFRNIAFFLSNLSRKNNNPQFLNRLTPFLNILAQFLYVEDEETMIESTWGLYNMSEQNWDYISKIQQLGVISKIIKNILSSHDKLKWASLRFVSLVARGPDAFSAFLHQNNIYIYLSGVLDSKWSSIRKEALYCISNLVAEEREESLLAFVDSDIFFKIGKMVMLDEFKVVNEGIYVLTNFVHSANPNLIRKFVGKGGLKVLVQLLEKYFDTRDIFLVNMIIAVDKILGTEGKDELEFLRDFVGFGGIEVLKNGKNAEWLNMSEKCIEVWDKYFREKFD